MPFGEDLFAGIGNRTGETGLKYSASGADLRQKFTGYQKDNETNLDFAEARMYQNSLGRFTAVDPFMASGRSELPQTWNRYSYCLNNPVNCTDGTGMDGVWGMQYSGGGVRLRHFESEDALRKENDVMYSDFCKQNGCNEWTAYNREYFLWADQTVSHLGSDGTRTDFSVATIGGDYWNDLVSGFYSKGDFSDNQKLMLDILYDRKLQADKFDEVVGLKPNPNRQEMGIKNPILETEEVVATARRAFTVGRFNELREAAAESGLSRHHVGQGSLMERLVPDYDYTTGPAILVPREGHIVSRPGVGVLSRNTNGFTNAREVLARDILELRRVYPEISNSDLRQLIHLNRTLYPSSFLKPPR